METTATTEDVKDIGSAVSINGRGYETVRYSSGTPYSHQLTNFTFNPLAVIKVNGNDARTILQVQRKGAEPEQLDATLFGNVAQFKKWCLSRKLQSDCRQTELDGLFALLVSADVPELVGIEQVGLHVESKFPRSGSFILPNGDVIGNAERYTYAEPATRVQWDTDLRRDTDWDPFAVGLLAELHKPEIMTPLLGWIAASPLRALFDRGFPVLGIFGSSGWGKTTLIETALDVFGFHTGPPLSLGGATPHGLKARMAGSNGIPVWFDEYRADSCSPDTLKAIDQAWRKSWDGGTVETGGGAGSWAELVSWQCLSPLLMSGETAITEVSLLERTVVLELPPGGRNTAALIELRSTDMYGEPAHDWIGFGRCYLEWLHEHIAHLHPPQIADRQEHGLAVVKWGYGLLQAFLYSWCDNETEQIELPDFNGSRVTKHARVNSELTKYLDDGWDPVIRADIDGANALPLRLDQDNRNLGRYSATRRAARAVYLASAPREEARRGIDLKLITLGVAQPGEAPGTFADALRRLSSEATYLYVDGAQYWYSLRANITRLAADRAISNFTDDNADDELRRRLQTARASGPFAAIHAFPDGPGDVTDDDDGVHLVLLPTTVPHVPNADSSPALAMAEQILAQRNAGPRINRNLLVFCAPSEARLTELRTATRQFLAWKSILEDKQNEKLELTRGDEAQARSKLSETDETVTQRIAETYQHILVPEQTPGTRDIRWHQTRPTGTGTLAERIAKKLDGEERLITTYGGTRVRMDLDRIPLWSDRKDISVDALWKAYCQFPYLPRLASFNVLAEAISDGVSKINWQGETFAYADGHDGTRWVGLASAQLVNARRSGYVVAAEAATEQLARERKADAVSMESGRPDGKPLDPNATSTLAEGTKPEEGGTAADPTFFYGLFPLDTVRGIRQLEEILRNVVQHLSDAPDGSVQLTLEVNGSSTGFDDRVRRVVTENSKQLGARSQEFE
jgi:hypothetical protein